MDFHDRAVDVFGAPAAGWRKDEDVMSRGNPVPVPHEADNVVPGRGRDAGNGSQRREGRLGAVGAANLFDQLPAGGPKEFEVREEGVGVRRP